MLRLAWVFFFLSTAAFGQGSVTIFGSVVDASGAAVPQAVVIVSNEQTGLVRQAKCETDGSYIVSQLPIGVYSVTSEMQGFKKFVQRGVEVSVDENRRIDIHLQVGAVNESVQVTAETEQVETRSGTLREVIDSERITELPLNGRNALQLQYLVAGAGGTVTAGQEQNDSLSINGSRPNTNNYSLDGADNHDPYFNTPSVFPNPDALQEFSLQTNAFSADRGRNAGALMNAVTRSGTNRIHGTAFEFLRNEIFNARSFFALTTPPFRRNQYGGTVGGPIRRDKTFYFLSFQGTREKSTPNALSPTVLTPAQRDGDFSTIKAQLKDPLGGNFTGNIIPASRISPISQKFLDAFVPLPNSPNGIYTFASNQSTADDQVVTKVDHVIRDNDRLSARLLYNRNENNQSVNNITLPGFLALIQYRNWNLAVTDTYILSARLVNTLTFGFNDIIRDQVPIVPGNKGWKDFGAGFVRAAEDPQVGFDTLVTGYFEPQARYPLHHYRKSLQFSEGLNWMVGSHYMKFGADIRRNLLSLAENFETDPLVTFTATNTGNAASDFLIGRLATFTQIAPDTNHPQNTELGMFAQDDWKITRKLTLNLGLRFDPYFPFSDPDNRFAQVRLGQQSKLFPNAPLSYVFPGDPGVPASTVRNDYGNWGPRFGFAYAPFANGKTSIRGGYGIFYSQARQQANNQVSNNQPFSLKLTGTNPKGGLANPYSDTGNPFPFQAPTTSQEIAGYKFLLPLNVTEWDPNFRDARIQQWNFTLQQQVFGSWLLQGAYVGSKGNHLFMQNELNPTVYGAAGSTADQRRAYYPTFSTITDMLSVANSTYHAMQLTANKRMSHGLTVLASYTWAKSIDNASGDSAAATNPYDFSFDKGLSVQDIPHRFVASAIWRMPGLRNQPRLVREVLGGWTINGIGNLQSGTPFNITSGKDNSGSAINNDRADVIGDWHLDNSSRPKSAWLNQYFNTAAFVANAKGTFGSIGRNVLLGPSRQNLDMGLLKDFPLVESIRLQFRGEAFNILNHANFGNPNGNVSAANYGRITTATTPRILQLALKVIF